jgi:hypothetical protein
MWTDRLDRVEHGFGRSLPGRIVPPCTRGKQVVQQPRVVDRREDGPSAAGLPVSHCVVQCGMVSTVDGEGVAAACVDVPEP